MPLYTYDAFIGFEGSKVPEKVYFNWFYSLFPNSKISDKQFLSEVMNTFFDLICEFNEPFLLADNLDESVPKIWYQFKEIIVEFSNHLHSSNLHLF